MAGTPCSQQEPSATLCCSTRGFQVDRPARRGVLRALASGSPFLLFGLWVHLDLRSPRANTPTALLPTIRCSFQRTGHRVNERIMERKRSVKHIFHSLVPEREARRTETPGQRDSSRIKRAEMKYEWRLSSLLGAEARELGRGQTTGASRVLLQDCAFSLELWKNKK